MLSNRQSRIYPVMACLLKNEPASCCYVASLTLKGEAERKRVLKRRQAAWRRPEAGRSSRGQAEARAMPRGGPNPPELKIGGMSCG